VRPETAESDAETISVALGLSSVDTLNRFGTTGAQSPRMTIHKRLSCLILPVIIASVAGCVSDVPTPDDPAVVADGKADQDGTVLTLSQRVARGDVEFRGTTSEGSVYDDDSIPTGNPCNLKLESAGHRLFVSLDVSGSEKTHSFGFPAWEATDFTADGFRSSRTEPIFANDHLLEESVHNAWFDRDDNSLSMTRDSKWRSTGLNPFKEWTNSSVTLYLGLTADRSSVTHLRVTASLDGDQDTVIDCVF
jgi:hypothetical protein